DKSIPLGSERWVSLFEKSVSLAASILYHANERGYETALVFLSGKPSKMIEPNTGKRHLYRMLEALALVQPEVGVECDLNLPAYILRGSLVYLVAAGERKSLFEKEKSLRRAGCWVRVILADAKDGGGRQSFEVCEVRADA
ncbi:MAG: hypothetical protein N2234_03795, partial [Planctomycetota bacterium]|nr:hypothetical protein [Planctomycetota bacterium]